MANTKSAAKRSRQSLVRANQNRSVRARVRGLQKRARATDKPDAEQIRNLVAALDKAAKRGVIHRNAADRRKARLNKLLSGAGRRK
jgi:small subunit ribosomal protein S20